jgi:hypothetical protein
MTVLGWTISLGTSLWTSHHKFLATGAAALALLWPIILFWPEIKLLRIAYPKNTIKLESPAWLYVFGVVSLGALLLASYRVYSSTSVAPRTLTADEFAQPLISGKFFLFSRLCRSNNIVAGRTVEYSYIYGPAVIVGSDHTDIGESDFRGSMESNFIEISGDSAPKAGHETGSFWLMDCKFRHDHFINISMVRKSRDDAKDQAWFNNINTQTK